MAERRLGAYILPGDPTWLAKTLAAYYPLLDDLVVPVPVDAVGWTGRTLPVEEVLAIVRAVDHRGILRIVEGVWIDTSHPMHAETAQRQAALDALVGRVDWVLQIDNDEFLPHTAALSQAIDAADDAGLSAIEWPMRVLFRRTRRWVYEVVSTSGGAVYDYPGPIAVRPGVRLAHARRIEGSFLRPTVVGDDASLLVRRAAATDEMRWIGLQPQDAIVHNSWARSATAVWQKTRSWGHADGLRTTAYYALRWMPAPVTWRFARDLHPFAGGLWPRLARRVPSPELTDHSR